MADDINTGTLVGRLTRDAEMAYTNGGTAYSKFSIACSKSRKVGESWADESHFFDFILWGKRAEGLNQYLTKGQQVCIKYSLKQDRWEQEGKKRSKVAFDIEKIQLLGGKRDSQGESQPEPKKENYTPPESSSGAYEDEIPF